MKLKEELLFTRRPRRNRKSPEVRGLVQETTLSPRDLVAPLFVTEGSQIKVPILSMPDQYRLPIDLLLKEAEELLKLDIRSVVLFPVVAKENKDAVGSYALSEENILTRAIQALKMRFPELLIIADVALDPYADHGHDGLVSEEGEILNDETVEVLAKMALHFAEAGADVVAPSDMMDGRVAVIRQMLDQSGFTQTSILSYSAKYASAFYGPFRDALDSKPSFGDKKSYQMNPANRREALLESALDMDEGADFLLVKPALPYLDVLYAVKEATNIPVGAYHVSGEYAMVLAAAEKGWVDADKVFAESLLAIKRAGADFIFSYAAKRIISQYRFL